MMGPLTSFLGVRKVGGFNPFLGTVLLGHQTLGVLNLTLKNLPRWAIA